MEGLFDQIRKSHTKIIEQQEKLDSKEHKSWGAAVAIQQEREHLKSLRSKLPKPRLVHETSK